MLQMWDSGLFWFRWTSLVTKGSYDMTLNTARMSAKSDSEADETILAMVREAGSENIIADEISKAMLTEAQHQDTLIRKILDKLSEWSKNNTGQSFSQDKDGTLYLIDTLTKRWRICVPMCYRRHILGGCHDDIGGSHMGQYKTLDKVGQRFFWIGMAKDVREYVKACEWCSSRKSTRKATEPNLISLPPVNNPFDRIAVDFVGPLPKTPDGNKYILVFIDYATRWPEAFACKDMKATTVAEIFIREILCRHGAPVKVLSDQGRNFLSDVVKEICEFTRTTKIQTAAYHPQTNGLCERFNGTLYQILSAYTNENQTNWDTMLPIALFGYRMSAQESMKHSPAELLYARQMRLPMDFDLFAPKLDFSKRIKDNLRRAQDCIARVAKVNKDRHDSKHSAIKYEIGDFVRVSSEVTKVGLSRKLRGDLWSKPIEIVEVIENNVRLEVNGKSKLINMARIKLAERKLNF